ncbi:amino acid ABC transporter permease [Aeromicrobium endophyticum]|uniref:Amino acid ABC transporter permease n=1 Tax=Aeromicrobium endophyticum TaxID=2292704 RepID=A0A371P9V0_9ACTN|nr:amino acid ABC transporter permease [Aeromicrobium endophyticum]REK72220.1 amino acid ABC transporter permease [Aeromicrobium endophyticum]
MDHLGVVLGGVPTTLLVTATCFGVGAVLGLVLVTGRRSGSVVVRGLSRTIIDLLRGIPPIVFLFIVFFGIGSGAIRLSPFVAAVIGLGLISAAHLAEIYRGSLLAVHRGQFEAAQALGLGRVTTYTRVVGPQAVRVAIPGMVTWAISLLKDSALVSTIGVAEIMSVTNQDARSSGSSLTPFVIAAAIYIALGSPLAYLSRYLERKLSLKGAR